MLNSPVGVGWPSVPTAMSYSFTTSPSLRTTSFLALSLASKVRVPSVAGTRSAPSPMTSAVASGTAKRAILLRVRLWIMQRAHDVEDGFGGEHLGKPRSTAP